MPRKRVVAKREIIPDPKYGNELLAKFVNVIMKNGKKSIAEKIIYGAMAELETHFKKKQKSKKEEGDTEGEGGQAGGVITIFEDILANVQPSVEVRSRRVGGATYQVPVEVRPNRSIALAMRWLMQAARSRSEKGMSKRLAAEMIDAYEGRGAALKKREDTHRMAKANQAFAHFRWN